MRSILQKDGDINNGVNHRIKVAWLKWRQVSSVLCDPRVPLKLRVCLAPKYLNTIVFKYHDI
jgi:hypothetical protein